MYIQGFSLDGPHILGNIVHFQEAVTRKRLDIDRVRQVAIWVLGWGEGGVKGGRGASFLGQTVRGTRLDDDCVGQDEGTCGSSVEASLSEMVKINCARQVSGIWAGGGGRGREREG